MSDGTLQTLDVSMLDDVNNASGLIQLDSNAKIPACSGAAITGLSSVTKNASDPAVATNPSGGVGSVWQNTTSGNMFICTDATAGSNVWTNIGAGTGNIKPFSMQGSNYGYCAGGYSWNGSVANYENIDRWSYDSNGNAVDVGDLEVQFASGAQQGFYEGGSASSETHGYVLGGGGMRDDVEKYSFATATENASKVGDLVVPGNQQAASDGTNAYMFGWTEPMNATRGWGWDGIQKYVYATDVCTDSTANLSSIRSYHVMTQSATHAYCVGGRLNAGDATGTDSIDKWQFATTNDATDVANLLGTRRNSGWGSSSTTHGYVAGGVPTTHNTNPMNSIEKHQFSNDADSTDVGDLLSGATWGFGSNSSTTHGYGFGHNDGVQSYQFTNEITRFAFSVDGNATDVGDLSLLRGQSQGHQF